MKPLSHSFRSLFYQNVKTIPSKSNYYPMFFELVARVIFFNITECAAFTTKKRQNDFYVEKKERGFLKERAAELNKVFLATLCLLKKSLYLCSPNWYENKIIINNI